MPTDIPKLRVIDRNIPPTVFTFAADNWRVADDGVLTITGTQPVQSGGSLTYIVATFAPGAWSHVTYESYVAYETR